MTDAQQPGNPCAPFKLENLLDTEWKDVRLSFSDWMWPRATHGGDEIDGHYLNGYGVEGLVKAALLEDGVDLDNPDIDFNFENDTCYIHFKNLAVRAAEVAARMIMSRRSVMNMIADLKTTDEPLANFDFGPSRRPTAAPCSSTRASLASSRDGVGSSEKESLETCDNGQS